MIEASDARHRDLATKLRTMLDLAPVGRSSTIHHLFGILYAGQLRGMKGSELERIAASAGGEYDALGRQVGCSTGTISVWVSRYLRDEEFAERIDAMVREEQKR